MTTAARAMKAAEEARARGWRVREVIIEGRSFRLVLDDEDGRDDYELRKVQ